MIKLYKHQQEFLDKNPQRCLLCWDTGTGKTLTAIYWGDLNSLKTLVIVPKALKENWKREIKKHGRNIFIVISKEEFRRDWDKLPYFPAIIADEAHYFSGMKSQMSKNLRKYCKKWKVVFRLMLSATPYLSTPWNIYTLAGHLGYEWSYMDFRARFFVDKYIGNRVIAAPRPGIEDDIAKLVAGIGNIVKLDECADVPSQVFAEEKFIVGKPQKKAMEEIIDLNPVVKYTKHHQVENGTLKSDGYVPDKFWNIDKHDRIYEKCGNDDKIAVVCRYNLQIDALEKKLSKLKKKIFIIRGDVKNRDEIVQAVEKSKECIVLINAACSEGYELPSIGSVIFASLSFSYKDYKQMLGRFLRINKLKKNVYTHMITEDGIDQAVYDSIMKKQDFDISIYAEGNERSEISDTI